MVIWFHVWQDRVRDLMGVAHLKWFDYPLSVALSLIVLFAVVEIGQLIRSDGDLVSRLAGPGARFDGSCAPEMVRLPTVRRAVVDRTVRSGRDRPAHQIGW